LGLKRKIVGKIDGYIILEIGEVVGAISVSKTKAEPFK
jgi:hypothetical protein